MKKNGFLEGAFIATISVIICKILGLIYVIPFYSIIGEQGGALYSYAYSIYSIFLSLATVGIPTAISKIFNVLVSDELPRPSSESSKLVVTNEVFEFSVLTELVCVVVEFFEVFAVSDKALSPIVCLLLAFTLPRVCA